MLEVEDSSEGTVVDRLEVSVSPVRGSVNVLFFVSVSCSENFIGIIWIRDFLLNCVTKVG